MRLVLALLMLFAAWDPAVAAAAAKTVARGGKPISLSLPFSPLTGPARGLVPSTLAWGSLRTGALTQAPLPAIKPALSAQASAAPAAATLATAQAAIPRSKAAASLAQQIPGIGSALAEARLPSVRTDPVEALSTLEWLYDNGSLKKTESGPAAADGDRHAASDLQPASKGPAGDDRRDAVPNPEEIKASRRAWLGIGIYKLGMEAVNIAMPLISLTVFGSAVWMATMSAGWGACMTLASLLAGGLIDRKPTQKVLAGALVAQAGLVAGIIGLLTLGVANPWLIFPLYGLVGATQGVVLTAWDCLPARIFGRDAEVLAKFNAKAHMAYETGGILGPVVIYFLIKANLVAALLLQPPAFLLAAWLFYGLKASGSQPAPGSESHRLSLKQVLARIVADVREGAKVILSNNNFRWLAFLLMGPLIVHRVLEQMVVPVFVKGILNSPEKASWIVSSSNLGEWVGAFLLLRALKRDSKNGTQDSSFFRWIRPMALGTLGAWAFAAGSGLWLALPMIGLMSLAWAANDRSLAAY
jgi:MFS family permease